MRPIVRPGGFAVYERWLDAALTTLYVPSPLVNVWKAAMAHALRPAVLAATLALVFAAPPAQAALRARPALLLADKPTGNLETRSADSLFALLRRLHAERGFALMVVTHDARLADRCDRIIELVDGRIVSDAARLAAA